MQTNFFSFGIAGDSFQAQTLPYTPDKLDQLRLEHNAEYSFFRYGEVIVISPHSVDAPQLGTYATFDPFTDPDLVGSLLRHLLFQEFRTRIANVVPTSFAPLEFPSRKDTHDPIGKLLPDELQKIIGFPRVISIAVERITQGGKPKHGLLVSYRNRWQLSLTLKDLQEEGYPIVGSEVLGLEPLEGLQGVLAPKESLLGGECGGDTAQAVECGGDTAQAELSNALLDREASTKCCVSGLDVSGLDVVRGTERAETGEETRGGNQEETRRKPGGNQEETRHSTVLIPATCRNVNN